MRTVYLKLEVPDGAEIIGCDIWVEQFCETYKKQSHLTEFTEIQLPTEEEIKAAFPDNSCAAKWAIEKIKAQ